MLDVLEEKYKISIYITFRQHTFFLVHAVSYGLHV